MREAQSELYSSALCYKSHRKHSGTAHSSHILTLVLQRVSLRRAAPCINFLLSFIPDCKFMRILLSFQLWLLPLLDEKKSSDRRWGLESFYYVRITDFPWVGRKTWTTHHVKQWRLRSSSNQCACAFSFPLFQLGHAKRKKKEKKLYSTWPGSNCNKWLSQVGSKSRKGTLKEFIQVEVYYLKCARLKIKGRCLWID